MIMIGLQLRWLQPRDGGCPIQSFSILSDLGDPLTSIDQSLEADQVENLPYKFEHTFTFTLAENGLHLRFKLQADNEIGSSISEYYL